MSIYLEIMILDLYSKIWISWGFICIFYHLFYVLVLHNDINKMSSGHPWIGNPLPLGISIGNSLNNRLGIFHYHDCQRVHQ